MKRILFIMDTFPLGGISKSLLALLNEIEDKYDVDLLLMEKSGLFVPLIPNWVHVIDSPMEASFRNPHPKGFVRAFRNLSFGRFLAWCDFSLRCILGRLTGGLAGQVNAMDVWLGRHTETIVGHYDAAIAYQGGRCIYYLVEKIDADVKIGYVHSNYSVNPTDNMLKPADSVYFPQLDTIVTISEVCKESLIKEFPELRSKVVVVENICSQRMINSMANEGGSFEDDFDGVRIVSLGRIDIKVKGLDMIIEACKILKENGLKFRWYWLGDGAQRCELEQMIKNAGVQDVLILAGAKVNPYPFVKDADLYVQPSRVEGKSVALDEVKALHKPIVVTKFGSVYDQFTDGENALIAEIDPRDVAAKIMYMIDHPDVMCNLSNNLSAEKKSNEGQSVIFESLLSKKV